MRSERTHAAHSFPRLILNSNVFFFLFRPFWSSFLFKFKYFAFLSFFFLFRARFVQPRSPPPLLGRIFHSAGFAGCEPCELPEAKVTGKKRILKFRLYCFSKCQMGILKSKLYCLRLLKQPWAALVAAETEKASLWTAAGKLKNTVQKSSIWICHLLFCTEECY